MKNEVIIGDCADVLKQFPDESIDCIVTDPPYGYSFMGLQWDKALPSLEALKECCRVLKSGAFGFFMCAPRQDVLSRMIIRLEDVGFNVNFSSLYHTYSSGFPKAANASKIVDRRLGAERELIQRIRPDGKAPGIKASDTFSSGCKDVGHTYSNIPLTQEAKALDGAYLGFQPKPALENIICVQKQLSIESQLTIITSSALYTLGEFEKCLDPENLKFCISANNVETNFTQLPIVKEYFAQRNAMDSLVEEAIVACGKVGGLYDLTDMSKYILELKETEPQIMSSNIVWLWKNILVDILSKANKFTIGTAIDLITELKILNWLLSQSIRENTTIPSKTLPNGMMLYVPIVENHIVKLVTKLNSLNQTTALGNVGSNTSELKNQKSNANTAETSLRYGVTTSLEKENTVLSNVTNYQESPKIETEVIITVMKPLSEKSYLDQALKNSHGVTWLDSVRIPYQNESEVWKAENKIIDNSISSGKMGILSNEGRYETTGNNEGRFPANLLCSDNCLDNGIITKSGTFKGTRNSFNGTCYGEYGTSQANYTSNEGQFSRYFSLDAWFDKKITELPEHIQKTYPFLIVPKPSKSEKNKYIENKHPTVKPLKLMSYLITMGSREGDVILDPFAGSGTTLEACKLLNRVFIGIDKDPGNEKYMRARGQLDEITLESFQEVEI